MPASVDMANSSDMETGHMLDRTSHGAKNGELTSADVTGDAADGVVIRKHSRASMTSKSRVKRLCLPVVCALLLLALVTSVVVMVLTLRGSSSYVQIVSPIGTVQGRIVTSPQGVPVEEYLGIPYAEPPVGALRYADPRPLKKLPAGEFRAIQHGPSCMQTLDTTFGDDFEGSNMWNAPNELSEDCLYLNVWLPASRMSLQKRAVMVWIYGGGFFSGSSALYVYDGRALAARGDVIVVTFNYRVGSLGFLATGDGRIKGNFGLKDQVVALQWVHDNIAYFGGDVKRVTVFGESSGASSAGLHMMSSHSSHLFQRAIFESGSPDVHWAFMTSSQATQRSELFFSNVNCPQTDTDKLLTCLRALDTDTILANEWVDLNFLVFPWVPTVDSDVLTSSPYELLKTGSYAVKDTLLGVNSNEGSYWILYGLPAFSKDNTSLQTDQALSRGIDTIAWDLTPSERHTLLQLYQAPDDATTAQRLVHNRDALCNVCGDRSFTSATMRLAKAFAQRNNATYFYHLDYRASTEVWPEWMGVIHGAEIQWIFGMPVNKSRGYTEKEVQFSERIMDYWANFAKTGNPNTPSGRETWPPYSSGHLLEWGADPLKHNVKPLADLRQPFCRTWDVINKQYNDDVAPTT